MRRLIVYPETISRAGSVERRREIGEQRRAPFKKSLPLLPVPLLPGRIGRIMDFPVSSIYADRESIFRFFLNLGILVFPA